MSEATNGDRPELPNGWVEQAAGEILTFEYGKGLPARSRIDGGVGVYASAGRVGSHNEALVAEDVIVVGRKGAAGNVFIGRGPSWVIDTAYYATVSSEHDIQFLAYQLQAADLVRLDQSTAIPSLSRDHLRNVPLRIPPLDEQRRIVRTLDEMKKRLDAAAEPLWTAASRLVVFRAALLQQAVTAGDEQTVGDVLERIEAGRSFRCHGHPAPVDKWGVVKVSAMTWGDFREDENKQVLNESHVDQRWEIQSGDLLISRANTSEYVGATVLVGDTRPKLLLSDKSLRLVPKETEASPAWLYCALNAPTTREQMSALATGTSDSMRNLSQDKLRAIRLRVPPIDEQDRLARDIFRQLSMEQGLREAIAGQKEGIASLRRAVLRDAMRGRLGRDDARNAA